MAAEPTLAVLQRWMQAVVVHPGSIEEAVGSPEAGRDVRPADIGSVILPSASLSPAERVEVYQRMYLLRMEEALETDYPALQHFLGAERFRDLVRDYVQSFPSRSYSLNRLGDHLPEFVRTAKVPRPEFCHDLARLELAVSQVFDEEETPALTEAEIAAVPAEAWEAARLVPIAAFRLMALRYPAGAYLTSVKDDDHENHPRPRLQAEHVAVYRRDYAVWRHDLTRPAHDLLADLVAGRTLGEAVAAALGRGGRRAPTEEALFRWFREWMSSGIFQAVYLD